jgi:hypothetical protein
MKNMAIAGILLVLGVIALVNQRITYRCRDTVMDIGH